MEHQRAVSTEKQNKFLTENHLVAYNVSSRTGENVKYYSFITYYKLIDKFYILYVLDKI